MRKDTEDLGSSGDRMELAPAEMRKAEREADLWCEMDVLGLDRLNFRYHTFEKR